MMSTFADLPSDPEVMLALDKAHKAYIAALDTLHAELKTSYDTIHQKHNYFVLTAQSVLYEAMANAAREGFTDDDMDKVTGCIHG